MNTQLNIIHLIRRQDRLAHLLTQCSQQEISDISIHEAEDAKENNVPVKAAICRSHKRVVQFAQEQGLSNCIIAEDDITFTAPYAWQYFLSQIPKRYDLFCGVVYMGDVITYVPKHPEVPARRRIINGMSGTMTLYSVHKRFYDVILNLPDDCYIDRELGAMAGQYEYYVTPEVCCYQLGGFSDRLGHQMHYGVYLEGKKLFGVA